MNGLLLGGGIETEVTQPIVTVSFPLQIALLLVTLFDKSLASGAVQASTEQDGGPRARPALSLRTSSLRGVGWEMRRSSWARFQTSRELRSILMCVAFQRLQGALATVLV